MKKISVVILFSLLIAAGCGTTKKLIYKDDWEGKYTLIEYNCCSDTATKVKMEIARTGIDRYEWKLFLSEREFDNISGEALYEKNKLKFYTLNQEVAAKYFVEAVSTKSPIFWMEYSGPKYYTWWYNEMKDYRRSNKIFAGIDFHFKRATDR
ncbi:hypothetical protein [Ferruginibacter sp.]|nr:hypothetical protein [Ferruginibacter sp.]